MGPQEHRVLEHVVSKERLEDLEKLERQVNLDLLDLLDLQGPLDREVHQASVVRQVNVDRKEREVEVEKEVYYKC